MKHLPIIRIERTRHRHEQSIVLHFAYDVELVNTCKTLGARWSQRNKAWHLADTPGNIRQLIGSFRGVAWLQWPGKGRGKTVTSRPGERGERSGRAVLTPLQAKALHNVEQKLYSLNRSENTIRSYVLLLQRFFTFTRKPPSELTNEDVVTFQSDFLVKGGYATSTQRQFTTAIRYLFEAEALPAVSPGKVEAPKRARKLPKTLSRSEVMALLQACSNLKHRTVLSLLYSSGMRVGEAINLRLSHIDFESRALRVEQAKGRKDRVVLIGEWMTALLKDYLAVYRPEVFVFNGSTNMRYSPVSIRAVLQRAAKKARLAKHVTPHMLRHSYATHMIEDGVNLRYVQEFLGHSRPETTQLYTHVARHHLMNQKNPFDELMNAYRHTPSNTAELTHSLTLARIFNGDS